MQICKSTHRTGTIGVEGARTPAPTGCNLSEPKLHIVDMRGCGLKLMQVELKSPRRFSLYTWDISVVSKMAKNDPSPFRIYGIRWKFENRLGDVICTGISYNPHTLTPLYYKQYWLQGGGGAGVFGPSTPTNSALSVK